MTLITMGAGNVLVLKETLKSFSACCDEIIYGDLLLFPEDRETVKSYQKEFNIKIIPFDFNYLFKYGFSALLNVLASYATNDIVMYMNTSEVIDEDYGISKIINSNPDCNSFYFTHRQENHRWFRCYNRHELEWSGRIHEQLKGEFKPYHKPIFMMKDLPKDMGDPFKAKVFDTLKEIFYFNNYIAIVDNPNELGETDPSWLKFSTDGYDSFKERLNKKGIAYEAVKNGDYKLFMDYVNNSPDFDNQKFESNISIEYQNDKKFLL